MTDLTESLLKDPEFRRAYDANRPKRELALTLRALRKAQGLTQAELAARAGLSQSHVSKLEAATGPMPEMETVRRYAGACGMAVQLDFVPLPAAGRRQPARAGLHPAALAASVAAAMAGGLPEGDVVRLAHLTEAQRAAAERGETVTLAAEALAEPPEAVPLSVPL